MHKRGCTDFENLVNATSISSLANIMKLCKVVISVDTGTMHLACAVGAPIAVVFYKPDMIEKWAPREFLYKSIVIKDNYSTQNDEKLTSQTLKQLSMTTIHSENTIKSKKHSTSLKPDNSQKLTMKKRKKVKVKTKLIIPD